MIIEVLRENRRATNRHLLFVAPRGMGKTTLMRRVAAEVRRTAELNERWYPLLFSEEAYEVSTPGEFWLESLFFLSLQTEDERWQRAYEDLKREPDERRLRERALAQLLDFANEQGKRILLVVKNLNMLVGEQMGNNADWDLRHTLLNEPRIMLLATATSRFEEIEHIEKAWFDLFSIHELHPLDEEESATLWNAIMPEDLTPMQLRPIQILTGGNPRLLRVLAEFVAQNSIQELMENLIRLIDDHTEYFKSQLDNLPPVERKVFVSLLESWEPTTARAVAEAARLDVNKTSSLLARLIQRGAVVARERSRKKYYQVAERLYNIYYLMRRRTHPANRVKLAVRFMTAYFRGKRLVKIASAIAQEACQLDSFARQDHLWAYYGLLSETKSARLQREILAAAPAGFFQNEDTPQELRQLIQTLMGKSEQPALSLEEMLQQPEFTTNFVSQLDAWEKRFSDAKGFIQDFFKIGNLLYVKGRLADALTAYEKLYALLNRRVQEGRSELANDLAMALMNKGNALSDLGKLAEAIGIYDEAIGIRRQLVEAGRSELANDLARALMNKAFALETEKESDRAQVCYREVEQLCRTQLEKNVFTETFETFALLVTALTGQKKWIEALAAVKRLLPFAQAHPLSIQRIIAAITKIAAAGYAKEALAVLLESEGRDALEPLEVGLRIFLEEEPLAPQEVYEVGKDVANDIRAMQAQLAPPKPQAKAKRKRKT